MILYTVTFNEDRGDNQFDAVLIGIFSSFALAKKAAEKYGFDSLELGGKWDGYAYQLADSDDYFDIAEYKLDEIDVI